MERIRDRWIKLIQEALLLSTILVSSPTQVIRYQRPHSMLRWATVIYH